MQGGAAAPDPAAYGLSPPLFQPLTAYAARGRIFPAPARGDPARRVRVARPCHTRATSQSPSRSVTVTGPFASLMTLTAVAAAHPLGHATDLPTGHAGSIPVARSPSPLSVARSHGFDTGQRLNSLILPRRQESRSSRSLSASAMTCWRSSLPCRYTMAACEYPIRSIGSRKLAPASAAS